jgi:hypothetical protein
MKAVVFISFVLTATAYSQLKWDTPQRTFTVRPGQTSVATKYHFTNYGTEPVTITDIRTSCGCTTAALEKRKYAPGESGAIEAKFNFAGHTGHQEKWIFVSTDLSVSDPTLLSLAVDIPPDLAIQPSFVMWRVGDQLAAKTIRVTVPENLPANIVSVRPENPALKLNYHTIRPGKELEVKVTPPNTTDLLKTALLIKTDYPPDNPSIYRAYVRVQ